MMEEEVDDAFREDLKRHVKKHQELLDRLAESEREDRNKSISVITNRINTENSELLKRLKDN